MCGLFNMCGVVMIRKSILWFAVILTSLMIFGFSAEDGDKSENISAKVTEKVIELTENDSSQNNDYDEKSFKSFHGKIRKIGHILEFALLGVLTFLLAKSYNLSLKTCVIISLGYCLLFAASDELHQLFVDGRKGRIIDVGIDFCGSLSGTILCYLVIKLKDRLIKNK